MDLGGPMVDMILWVFHYHHRWRRFSWVFHYHHKARALLGFFISTIGLVGLSLVDMKSLGFQYPPVRPGRTGDTPLAWVLFLNEMGLVWYRNSFAATPEAGPGVRVDDGQASRQVLVRELPTEPDRSSS